MLPFSVDSKNSILIVVALEPLPISLAANFTADPSKPTFATTATPPPPINATRYSGFLEHLCWYLLRVTAGFFTLLVNWVYLCQDALTRHHVLPPSQPAVVFKKRAAGYPDGEQLSEAEIMQGLLRIDASRFYLFKDDYGWDYHEVPCHSSRREIR